MQELTLTLIAISVLLPAISIASFIIGYNINASKPVFKPKKKEKPSENQKMLDRIENATIYKTEK